MVERTKKIAGLPSFPSKATLARANKGVSPPDKRGGSVRKALGLVLTYDNRWLMAVGNPKGNLPPVAVVQTGYPGFTARLDRKPYTILGYGYRSAEKLAIRLARKGHKKVTIRT